MCKLTRLLLRENGNALILTALAFSVLLGFMGVAVDAGLLFRAKRDVQTAADAAAVAAALDYKYNGVVSSATSAADSASSANGVTDGSGGTAVTVHIPPSSGANAACGDCAEVLVSQPKKTYFMGMFNARTVTVKARAVAGHGSTENCMYLLGTSGADFNNTGAATINLHHCGLIDDSTSSNAFYNGGALTFSALSIGVVGHTSNAGAWSLSPTPTTGISPSGYPLNRAAPSTSSCSAGLSYPSAGTATINPGCYNGLSISGAENLTLNPGLYVFNGTISITGAATIKGTGVTIYFNNSIQLNGAATFTLSAPTSGTWNGILFYEDPSDTNTFALKGAASSNLQGIFFMPAAIMDVSGATSMTLYNAFVAKQLINSGAVTFTLQDYLQKNAASPLATVTLLE